MHDIRLFRFDPQGSEKPGLLDVVGMIRDLSGVVGGITGDVLSNSQLQVLRAFDPASVPLVEEVLDHVAGNCVVNDPSERDFQIHRSRQWAKGESWDTFGPIGLWLVTRDEVPNP